MERTSILVVDDDPFVMDVIKTVLEKESYDVRGAVNGQEALDKVSKHMPHLIVLDYMLPELDGYHVCLKLKEDAQYKHIPIIMLTARDDMDDKIKLLDAGVDDYILKPFDPRELVARVKMVLRRVTQSLDTNSLTKLPGDISFSKQIEEHMQKGTLFAVCSIELSDFKAFNERYGFEHGNRVIKEIAIMIKKLVDNVGNEDDFIGHIGGVNFVVITTPGIVDRFCTELINRFDLFIFSFYSPEDQNKGYILAHNREGDLVRCPVMKIRIAVATNEKEKIFTSTQISNIMVKLKEKTKSVAKSNYVRND